MHDVNRYSIIKFADGERKLNIFNHSYSGTVESAKMDHYTAEKYLEDMKISDIERFLRKKKLQKIIK